MGYNKKKPPRPLITNCNYEAQLWCLNNSYRVYPAVVDGGFNIHIDIGHQHFEITQLYKYADIYQGIWNTYETIFNKHKDAKKAKK